MRKETTYLLAGIAIGTGLGALVMVAVMVGGFFFLRGGSPEPQQGRQDEVAERFEGSPAFDFRARDINPSSPTHEQDVKLSSLYPEKGVLVNFMASWCPPCLAELPHLEEIQSSGITRVVCVAASEADGKEELIAMAGKLDLTLPLLYAPPEQAEAVYENYYSEFLPCSYVIDRSGVVRKVIFGAQPKEVLEREVRQALAAPSLARLKRHLQEGE